MPIDPAGHANTPRGDSPGPNAGGGSGDAARPGRPGERPDTLDEHALAALFAELRFADPVKASSLWKRLACAEEAPPAHPERVATLLDALSSSADPDLALLNLIRFVESTVAPGAFFNSIVLERPISRLAATIFSCSSYLSDILSLNPGYLAWLIEARTLECAKAHSEYRGELAAQVAPFLDARRRVNSVKRYFRREVLRIGARDLLGLAAVEEVTAELSFLADAVVETAAALAYEELAPLEGLPAALSLEEPTPFHRFAVISLGKLGGTELNYSSDIDLLFVRGETEDQRERAFYARLARRIVEILSQPTEEGALYRVDLRLRPDGESGPLVVSLEEHLGYLQRRARPWEKQALIKARYAAGNRHVAEAFIDNCSRIVYGPAPSGDPLGEILTMRERSIANLPAKERAANIKLMSGGIRDIEFIAQAMQLTHGRSRPEVRSRNTLEALERLAHYGLLSRDVKETLERGYRLLRTVEHRLQMARNVRTHTLPADEREMRLVAARVSRSALAGVTPENFRAELSRAVLEIQHLFKGFFEGRAPGAVPLILSLPPGDAAVEELLARFGVLEGEQAHRSLSSLVFGEFPNLEGAETFAAAAATLPSILVRVSETPDPSLTVKNLVRIVKATKAVKSALELLAAGGDFQRLILSVAALSTRFSETLGRSIGLLDVIVEGATAPEPPAPDRDPRAAIEGLAAWYEETLLSIHVDHPIPAAGPEDIAPLLARSAERVLERLFARSAGAARGVALFAAGSFGGRSMRLGSDLDLIAVARDGSSLAGAGDAVRSMLEEARAVRLGPIDLRLRGEGESAPLVQTLASYETYVDTRAQLWEILAYTKCRFLFGDERTGAAFDAMLRSSLPRLLKRGDWKERILESRAKLEALAKNPWDVKHAAGGLYDIDFMLSIAYLLGLIDAPGSGARRRTFAYLETLGLVDSGDPDMLAAANRLFWTMEHAAALHAIPYPPLPDREQFFERYFDRLFADERPDQGGFREKLERTRDEVRACFRRFMERAA